MKRHINCSHSPYFLNTLFLFALFLSPVSAIADSGGDYSTGFHGITWGATLASQGDKLVESSNSIPPFDGYEKTDENLTWEGVKATGITYGFSDNKFAALNIAFSKNDVDAVVSSLEKKFGKTTKTDLFIMVNYEWHTKQFDISLVSTSNGASFNLKVK